MLGINGVDFAKSNHFCYVSVCGVVEWWKNSLSFVHNS